MDKPSCQWVLAQMERKGYRIFDGVGPAGERRDLDLNLFGVRSASQQANRFDDWVGVFWHDPARNDWQFHVWAATTDPGTYWLKNPMSVAGTAVLVPGQYRSSHTIGQHQGKYTALVQNTPLSVYRDGDRDDVVDMSTDSIQVGRFGINIHRASAFQTSTQVDKWSAGCQVLANPGDFALLMDICTASAELWGPTFTYTLLDAAEAGT